MSFHQRLCAERSNPATVCSHIIAGCAYTHQSSMESYFVYFREHVGRVENPFSSSWIFLSCNYNNNNERECYWVVVSMQSWQWYRLYSVVSGATQMQHGSTTSSSK